MAPFPNPILKRGIDMKYKVLVADDEYIIRSGIISFLKRYDDFEVAAEAEDGEMALEEAEKQDIDVYFVDINMPFLNGLQFIEKLKGVHPDALVVVITGYDRFEYARKALQLGTFEYLLKPIMEKPFDEMIQRVRKQLAEQSRKDKYLDWARRELEKNRKRLISDFLQRTLEGHYSGEEVEERSKYLALRIPQDFVITVIWLEYKKEQDLAGEWDDDLIYFVAENVANEIFNDLENMDSCQDAYGNLVVISPKIAEEEFERKLKAYREMLESHVPVSCLIVWKCGSGYAAISSAYLEAAEEMEGLKGGSSIVKEVKAFVELHYQDTEFSLQDAAEHVNLSVQYLSKMFRKEMGVTFVDYLTSVRIRKSIELLHSDEWKIYEIAEKVGYTTQHYFSNVFKKSLGLSPAEYRRMLRE